VAPPVFKTGLAGIAFAGGFDSLPLPAGFFLISLSFWGVPTVAVDVFGQPACCGRQLALGADRITAVNLALQPPRSHATLRGILARSKLRAALRRKS
jgi:hypothetical protein